MDMGRISSQDGLWYHAAGNGSAAASLLNSRRSLCFPAALASKLVPSFRGLGLSSGGCCVKRLLLRPGSALGLFCLHGFGLRFDYLISPRRRGFMPSKVGNGAFHDSADAAANDSFHSDTEFVGYEEGEGNGHGLSSECFRRILCNIRSVLPGGSWWKVNDCLEEDERRISVVSTMQRLWLLVAPDGLIIGTAFLALVMAAISEVMLPHFIAATIFSAQSGMGNEFVGNSKLLALMSCLFGLFSGLRGCCFGIANQNLVRRMREKLFSTILCQDIAFFDTEAVGVLTSRLGSDCQQVSRIIGSDLNIILRNVLQALGSLFYLMLLSWQLSLSTLLICSVMWCLLVHYGRYQRSTAKSIQDSLASANETCLQG